MKIQNKELKALLNKKVKLIKTIQEDSKEMDKIGAKRQKDLDELNEIKYRVQDIMEEVLPENDDTIIESIDLVKGEVVAKVMTKEEYIEKSKEIAIESWEKIKSHSKLPKKEEETTEEQS